MKVSRYSSDRPINKSVHWDNSDVASFNFQSAATGNPRANLVPQLNTDFLAKTHVAGPFFAPGSGGTIISGNRNANTTGGPGDDIIIGTTGDDVLNGLGGNDTIDGSAGNDSIDGGDGDDWISGGAGTDVIDGGNGEDTVSYIDGGAVTLNFTTPANNSGDAAGDTYANVERFQLSNFEDLFIGLGGTAVSVSGGAGNDQIMASQTGMVVNGGEGDDLIVITGGNNNVRGDEAGGVQGFDVLALSVSPIGLTIDMTPATTRDSTFTFLLNGQTQTVYGDIDAIIGGNFNDSITGNLFDNYLSGDNGDDSLFGGAGNDDLNGGDGNDFLQGDEQTFTLYGWLVDGGNDILDGGAGNDSISGGGGVNVMSGGGGNDVLFLNAFISSNGSSGSMNGGDGDDMIVSSGSRLTSYTISNVEILEVAPISFQFPIPTIDLSVEQFNLFQTIRAQGTVDGLSFVSLTNSGTLNVGTRALGGIDITASGSGNTIIGATGADGLHGRQSVDTLNGGGGNDTVEGFGGADLLYGGDGTDIVNGGADADNLWGGAGADQHTGGDGLDFARYDDANHGNLIIRLDAANLNTGAAAGDTYAADIEGLVGGTGNDTVVGNASANYLYGSGGDDYIFGQGGADSLVGGSGTNQLYGGVGADSHVGGTGIDYARYDDANHGNLTIRLDVPSLNTGAAAGDSYTGIEGVVGGLGNDVIVGNAANNYIFGGGGADYINGLTGSDYLSGGAGADRFAFSSALNASTNVDRIADFASGVDDFNLAKAIFASIGATLDATELRLGIAAADANDYLIYNSTNGQLFYDANGNAAGGQTLFATVAVGTVLNTADFVMV
ncbi:MAG: beta strand repeat-containing protein [Rhizobiaceae bacterium]